MAQQDHSDSIALLENDKIDDSDISPETVPDDKSEESVKMTDQLVLDINQEQHGNNPLNNVENISDGAKFVQLPECDSNKSEKNFCPPQENISSSKQKSIIGDGNFLRRIAGGVPREEVR